MSDTEQTIWESLFALLVFSLLTGMAIYQLAGVRYPEEFQFKYYVVRGLTVILVIVYSILVGLWPIAAAFICEFVFSFALIVKKGFDHRQSFL